MKLLDHVNENERTQSPSLILCYTMQNVHQKVQLL